VLSDEALVTAYLASREAAALETLVSRHLVPIRNLVFRMVLDDHVADDLTQEVFLQAIRGLPSFRGRAKFSTWLYRVAMNAIHKHLGRERRSPIEFREELPDAGHAGSPPDQAALSDELQGVLETALAELDPVLRAALVLTCLGGLPIPEAAAVENCSLPTMYWRIHRARRLLKCRLQKYLNA
jgi:RNA polymerase sigma-70 factor (ECF subfamily)